MHYSCIAFFEDLNTKDLQKISKWFEDNSVIWIPPAGPVETKSKITVYFRAVFQRYKELTWKVNEVLEVDENRFFVLVKSEGVFKDDRPYQNYLATELQFNENKKITLLSDYFKDTSCFIANKA